MTTQSLGLFLLLALVPIALADWACVVILAAAARHNGTALRERRTVALILAHAATLYFFVGTNTVLGYPWFSADWAPVFNRMILLAIGVIPIRFLYLYWRRKF